MAQKLNFKSTKSLSFKTYFVRILLHSLLALTVFGGDIGLNVHTYTFGSTAHAADELPNEPANGRKKSDQPDYDSSESDRRGAGVNRPDGESSSEENISGSPWDDVYGDRGSDTSYGPMFRSRQLLKSFMNFLGLVVVFKDGEEVVGEEMPENSRAPSRQRGRQWVNGPDGPTEANGRDPGELGSWDLGGAGSDDSHGSIVIFFEACDTLLVGS